MKTINTDNLVFPISEQLANLLATLAKDTDSYGVTINFRDEDYSADAGGYHPVEVRLERHRDQWRINYLTEFAYVGAGYFAELAKAINFDFGCGLFQTTYGVFAIEAGMTCSPCRSPISLVITLRTYLPSM